MSRPSMRAANDSGDDLWLVPPEKFVAARNALAARTADKELRKLKRPSPSAWLVNALARTAPKQIEVVFAAGDALHKAQGRVLAGADPSELHDAMRKVRDAVGQAWKSARAILIENGRKPTADLVRRVTHALRSAAIDKRLRELIEQGQLVADPSSDDLAALADVKVPPRGSKKKAPKEKVAAAPKEKAAAAREANMKAARLAVAAAKAKAAAAREEASKERARIAREAKQRLRAEAARAQSAVEDARRAVMRVEAEERRALAALNDVQREVTRAKSALKMASEAHTRAKKRRT